MNQLAPFVFEAQEVRVILDDQGEPWFVGADVCAALEIINSRDAMSRLDADEKGVAIADTPGGPQKVRTVSEPGVYRLVFTSRVEGAERFKRWLAHEVLPSVRKTGAYAVPGAAPAPGSRGPRGLPSLSQALRLAATLAERVEQLELQLGAPAPLRPQPGGIRRPPRPPHFWIEPIRSWLVEHPEHAEVGTTQLLTEAIGWRPEQHTLRAAMAVGYCMAALGWSRGRRRIAGALRWVYVRPGAV